MAELRRAEKLASAKKKLRQFQQKNRDSQSESGRSTPSKKKSEEEDSIGKLFRSENGGSSNSLCQSENFSSNISGTDSPLPALENLSETSQIINGNLQPDIINVTNVFNTLPNGSGNYFQSPSPQNLFSETLPVAKNKSASDFFDSLTTSYEASGGLSFRRDVAQMPLPVLNMMGFNPPHINASTPEGLFQDTPNYSFPDASVSPIKSLKNDTTREEVVSELEQNLQKSCSRNSELEQQVSEQRTHIIQLQTHLEEMKKKADEGSSTLKHHVQAIEILVSEKTELQNNLDKKQEELNVKNGEIEDLQGRLRASRHRVSDLERDLAACRAQTAALESSVSQLTTKLHTVTENNETIRKHVGDLELEVSDLQSKLENRDQTVSVLQAELMEKNSQLSLAEVRIQQLSGVGSDSSVVDQLQVRNTELSRTVESLQAQLTSAVTTQEQSVRDYQRYVEQLQLELQLHKTSEEASKDRIEQLMTREQQLVQQVSELERQLNRAPHPSEDPALRELKDQLALTINTSEDLKAQLAHKSNEVDCLREGLQERALRIQELEVTIERLEAERPNSANLQAAIESDKVAASRAVAQNNNLKKQLEELQEALVKLSNSKLELTQQLQNEQHLSKDLSEQLERIQDSSKQTSGEVGEVEKCQQTEVPSLQEAEVQTYDSQPVESELPETEDASSVPPEASQATGKVETAEQIRSLLTEIGSSNLVTSATDNTNINFHPCPWCSGRLITV
ncbi:golgin subfamily A member 2-like isoform X2 [Macrosteles quadrilineatus]|uniref:golgin subfamily A member 2-like isoform X2 n=1 Tax=Macrosteles quadrilineatus TaxID=74068 RepID=UPI0023E1F2B5|nr:golgin subfamily A member 2-like isoform X2 [Macrosteles quadrilineatus]